MPASESVKFEEAVRAEAAGVDDALGDALVVEVLDLFEEDVVFEQGRAALACLEGVFVVGDDGAGLGGEGRVSAAGDLVEFACVSSDLIGCAFWG